MNDDKKDDSIVNSEIKDDRRDLLKKLSVGTSGLAITKWTAPVIATIAVPAHAQTSTSFINSFSATAP